MIETQKTLVLRWSRKLDTWVYDDPNHGVKDEPLVRGTGVLLSRMREMFIGTGRRPFRVIFSAWPFDGASIGVLVAEGDGGAWYSTTLGGRLYAHAHLHWLCEHLFDYFDAPPERLYVRVVKV